jgi:hypothetical protein
MTGDRGVLSQKIISASVNPPIEDAETVWDFWPHH